jgi:hypothetical protein
MKRLLGRLLLLLPLGVLLVGINYKVDPAHLFSAGGYERGLVNELTQGHHVTDIGNFDERLFQRLMLGSLPKRPQVLILGSSRVLLMSERLFPGSSVYNAAMPGAVLEDILAGYALYTARGWYPDTLVIGLDPWMFNANHGQERWRVLAPEVRQMRRTLGLDTASVSEQLPEHGWSRITVATTAMLAKPEELLSLTYFQKSLKGAAKAVTGGVPVYRPTRAWESNGLTKHTDGSIAYDRRLQLQDAQTAANAYKTAQPLYALGAFTALAADTRKVLPKLVAHAQCHGAVVRLFLSPYHPTVWQFLQKKPEYQCVDQSEKWCRAFAAAQGVVITGAFDPTPFGLVSADFYDGMHCKPAIIERLFRASSLKMDAGQAR